MTAAGRRKRPSPSSRSPKSSPACSCSSAPGALRELHWHANAAEWAYVHRRALPRHHHRSAERTPRSSISAPGDVWYFPRGHGHSIQGLGPGDCHFILVFDNGYFSEFGTFSITDWIGHTPPEVLAKNFGVPAATFAKFPEEEVYIAKGPVPPPLPADPRPDRSTRRRSPIATACSPKSRGLPGGTHAPRLRAQFPISDDHDRRAPHHQARRPARAALASQCRRVAVLHRGAARA